MTNTKEKILWLILKNEGEYNFKRQFSCGKYVLDFYSADINLAIEFGDQTGETDPYHSARMDFISSKGIELITLPESFFQTELNNLLTKILNKRREIR
jgi:very-short-patch-repair endonuclease